MKVGKNKILVVVPDEPKETTKSGIVLPDQAEKKRDIKGVVVAIGEGVKGIEPRDEILIFNVYPQQILRHDGFNYCFVEYESSFYIGL